MGIRIFTPATARRSLAVIRPAAESMCRVFRVMERERPETIASDQAVQPRYFSMALELTATLDRLREAGVQVKDPRTGLIDFPARRAGRAVLLCWKVGEPDLGFWHEVEAGFAGRQPVQEDGQWEEGPAEPEKRR